MEKNSDSKEKTVSYVRVPGCAFLALVVLALPGLAFLIWFTSCMVTGSLEINGPFSQPAGGNGAATPRNSLPIPIIVEGQRTYFAKGQTLMVLDTSEPTTPVLRGSVKLKAAALDIQTSNSLVFVAEGANGLEIVDAGDSKAPRVRGSFSTTGSVHGVAISGRLALLRNEPAGLQIVDVTNVTSPTLVATVPAPAPLGGYSLLPVEGTRHSEIAVQAPYVYLTSASFEVIDISIPSTPRKVGSYYSANNFYPPFFVQFAGANAVVANVVPVVFDLTDPASPKPIGVYLPEEMIACLAASESVLLATNGTDLEIIDLRDPIRPVRAGKWQTPGAPKSAAIQGSLAYVAIDPFALQILDLSDPAKPVQRSSFQIPR